MADFLSKMILLESVHYQQVYELYLKDRCFYPLIAAVLLQKQDGRVFVNNLSKPSQVYVEHAFGFAQLFGVQDEQFERQLEAYLFVDQHFTAEKVRLYAPEAPRFLLKPEYELYRSYRQRFVYEGSSGDFHSERPTPQRAKYPQRTGFCFLDSPGPVRPEEAHPQKEMVARTISAVSKGLHGAVHRKDDVPLDSRIHFSGINATNIDQVDQQFQIVSRFWRNAADFIKSAHAVVVYYDKQIASICYAAAEANHRAEIDVLTLPEYRNLGLGKHAVQCFISQCMELSVAPLWDCFTNNSGSMMLCKSVGFVAPEAPYLFFTITRG